MRPTTSYRVQVAATGQLAHHLADELKNTAHNVAGNVDSSGVNAAEAYAYVRFRCPTSDRRALALADEITNGRPFRVFVGYGAHKREIVP